MKYEYKTVLLLKNTEKHVTYCDSDEPYRPWQIQNEVFKLIYDAQTYTTFHEEQDIQYAHVYLNDELVYDHLPCMKEQREFIKREKNRI